MNITGICWDVVCGILTIANQSEEMKTIHSQGSPDNFREIPWGYFSTTSALLCVAPSARRLYMISTRGDIGDLTTSLPPVPPLAFGLLRESPVFHRPCLRQFTAL